MAEVTFILAKISSVDYIAGAKFVRIETDNLSEIQQHDYAWAVGIREFPHFFPKESQEKDTTLKGHSLFTQSKYKGVDEEGNEFLTVLYRWEGRYRY